MATTPDSKRVLAKLNRVRWIALVDALLLVPLLIAAATGAEDVVSVLGPAHGIGFLLLLWYVGTGAGERLWGWWFPLLVVVTAGPPGSLYGDLRIRRSLRGLVGPRVDTRGRPSAPDDRSWRAR